MKVFQMAKTFADDLNPIKIFLVVAGTMVSIAGLIFAFTDIGFFDSFSTTEDFPKIIVIGLMFFSIFIIGSFGGEISSSMKRVSVNDDQTVSIPARGMLDKSIRQIFKGWYADKTNFYSYQSGSRKGSQDKNKPVFEFTKENISEARLAVVGEIGFPAQNRPLNQKYVNKAEKAVCIKFKSPLVYVGSGSWEGAPMEMTAQAPDFIKDWHEKLVPEKPIESVFISVKEPQSLIGELRR